MIKSFRYSSFLKNNLLQKIKKNLKKFIKDFSKKIKKNISTPSAAHLFKVNNDTKKMKDEKKVAFHHTAVQLLWASLRAQQNLLTVVSFS